ncbi:MAG: hypothetical protein AVDCRST_MAG26-2932 [uncultured Chloroflexia bacterium]|uniref:Aminoglycoside phosphotransferase domain-containing protein n=1 Tax=uncultured Chloroflexia bacterium TaxID=1672391 RepID=A0A6J4JA56_9CHLR|nr:MAG: hypothetical protein AVDCRST_MAG26-2932 [uncultured Chloroflexia bacterium]
MPPHDQLLPSIAGLDEYEALRPSTAVWLPAARAICDRHNLSSALLERLPGGTNVVFAAGPDHVVKLYPPAWARLWETERAVTAHVQGKLDIPTPKLLAHGLLEGWPYLVISRLHGRYLVEVWPGLDRLDQIRIVSDLGRTVFTLHSLPTAGLESLDRDWDGLVQQRLRTVVERHREQGVAEHWLRQIPAFLERARPLYPPDFRPTIISGDIHDHHLLAAEEHGLWRVSGLFDFDDARIGFHEYDLAAAGLFMMHGRRDLLRAFLLAYGYVDTALDEALSMRLLAWTLLHRYRPFNWWREELVGNKHSTTLDELAAAIYPL